MPLQLQLLETFRIIRSKELEDELPGATILRRFGSPLAIRVLLMLAKN